MATAELEDVQMWYDMHGQGDPLVALHPGGAGVDSRALAPNVEALAKHFRVYAPELRGLLAEHPFREGLSELLMLALYKSGRQAEALDVFGGVRQRLGDELGIDLGPSLQTMHQRLLRADRRLLDGTDLGAVRLADTVGAPLVA
jgi:pimeloyl-ACP methyl ester carboxylesterase